MILCECCHTDKPDLDIYGVCLANDCQRQRDHAIIKGEWFANDFIQQMFDMNHAVDSDADAVMNIAVDKCLADDYIYDTLQACVINAEDCIKKIITVYRQVDKDRENI